MNFNNFEDHGELYETYHIGPLLGKGGFGSVYQGHRIEDNLPIAAKVVMKANVQDWFCINERAVPLELILLDKVRSVDGVVQLLDWRETKDYFVFIMERIEDSKD